MEAVGERVQDRGGQLCGGQRVGVLDVLVWVRQIDASPWDPACHAITRTHPPTCTFENASPSPSAAFHAPTSPHPPPLPPLPLALDPPGSVGKARPVASEMSASWRPPASPSVMPKSVAREVTVAPSPVPMPMLSLLLGGRRCWGSWCTEMGSVVGE